MPGSGGTYVYLREAFQYRTGRLMPFLFVWTAMLFIPLIMSTGVVGFVSYLGYLWPAMNTAESDLVGLAMIVVIMPCSGGASIPSAGSPRCCGWS